MGCCLIGSSSSYDDGGGDSCVSASGGGDRPQNPDPKNFRIENSSQVGQWLIVIVEYPNCTNYEGLKILVYEDTTLEQLEQQGHIDPHFAKNKRWRTPFARFEPTIKGWDAAYRFCRGK